VQAPLAQSGLLESCCSSGSGSDSDDDGDDDAPELMVLTAAGKAEVAAQVIA
jgi:hypothetical protein